jgi:predicted 2-oxoglutarate/Fe(II)-dependent dioxygenase YbiX
MSDKPNLLAAAAAGDPRAQLALAHFMIIGRAPAPNADEPARLVRAACAQKFDEALLYQAMLAALGLGREQNLDEAYALVAEAAALGNTSARGQLKALGGGTRFDAAPWLAPPRLTQHAMAPRIFVGENFLPRAACDWFIEQARGKLDAARVATASNTTAVGDRRTNSVAGSSMLEPDLVMQLTRLRIAGALDLSAEQLEPTNVLRYEVGQEYGPHYDVIRPDEVQNFEAELRAVGQRCATVLVYLNDGYDGGDTEFPRLGQRFKGKPGDALIFWNLSAANALERDSLHAGLPVTRGEKWLLSQWVRERPLPLR